MYGQITWIKFKIMKIERMKMDLLKEAKERMYPLLKFQDKKILKKKWLLKENK